MPRVLKIFFHDNCFDGASSAAVFADFYRQVIDPRADVELQGVQHQPGDPFAGLPLNGDDNACLDFRFSPAPEMNWWFDHHASAFQPPELRAVFEADTGGHKFYDPTARSNTLFMTGVLRERFGYQLPDSFDEVVDWADLIDAARFTSPAQAVELAEPALQLMTWLEANRDRSLTHRFIELLGHQPLAEIAAAPWVRESLEPLLAAHHRAIELVRGRAEMTNGVVYFDLADDGVPSINKFISYFLHPEAAYTVSLVRAPRRLKVSVGANPWFPERRRHDISTICERYGGGGHPFVGAVSLAPDQIDRARQVLAEIVAELAA